MPTCRSSRASVRSMRGSTTGRARLAGMAGLFLGTALAEDLTHASALLLHCAIGISVEARRHAPRYRHSGSIPHKSSGLTGYSIALATVALTGALGLGMPSIRLN